MADAPGHAMTDALASGAGGAGVAGRRRQPVALATLCMVLFLTFVDITIVSVALAGIHQQLNTSVSALQWVIGAYALTFASSMLVFGTVGDQFGRKKVMLAGVGVYCVGALMAALSITLATSHHGAHSHIDKSLALAILLAGRAVMGLGAAASEPGTLSMLRHVYPEYTSRNRALGVWAAVSGFSLALGPVIGGALVFGWSWRAIFFFDVAFGLVAFALASWVLPENADPDAAGIDVPGAVFGAAALGALIFALMQAENAGYGSALVIALLCISTASFVLFVWRERRAAHPLLDLSFLRLPRFATPNVVAFCTYFATFALFSFTALFLQEVSGYNGGQIAEAFLPMTILMILASVLAGRWTDVVGIRASIVAGCAAFTLGLLLTSAVLSPTPRYLPLAGALALTGIGMGTCVVPITSSVLAVVPPERSGMAASTTNTSREVGTALGVAVLGALTISKLLSSLIAGLNRLHIPPVFQSVVINGVLTGQAPSAGHSSAQAPPGQGRLVTEVIQSAYSAFESGLHLALYVSAGLVFAAGLLTAITINAGGAQADQRAASG
jgi:EmrB/QacA subfamily drug resistance transporter